MLISGLEKINNSSSSKLKVSGIIIAVFLFPILFREVLVTKFGFLGQIISLIPLLAGFVGISLLKVRSSVKVDRLWLGLWMGWMLVLVPLFSLTAEFGHPFITPIIGLLQYVLPIFFASYIAGYISKTRDLARAQLVVKYLAYFSIITAFGALIQFHLSLDLFGLVSNRIYTNIENTHVTKRAISFIASPQALGAFLALAFPIISIHFSGNRLYKWFMYFLLFVAGLHTGSKSFVLGLTVYLFLISKTNFKLFILLLIGSIMFMGSSVTPSDVNDTLNRFLRFPQTILYISSYVTFMVWESFLTYNTSITSLILGNGIGSLATSSQTFFEYKILGGSAESFLVQLYFETGLVGIVSFLFFYIKKTIYVGKSVDRRLGAGCIALLFNMAFTPAFFGFTLACIGYLMLFFPKKIR